jgi:hypothetical protein
MEAIQNFDTIEPSTNTTIITSNILITDFKKLFNHLQVVEYVIIEKKRGRKSKLPDQIDPNKHIKPGEIISVQYEKEFKGVHLKKKKKSPVKKQNDFFRNSITIAMKIEEKFVNFKITNNGTFQITGTKTDKQRDDCIFYLWNLIKDQDFYTFNSQSKDLQIIMIPAMRNINWKLNVNIDREKMNDFINSKTPYRSILSNNVNIKVPYKTDIQDMVLTKKIIRENGEVITESILYKDYLNLLGEKDKLKKLTKIRNNTFLIFQTGVVIMSSINADFARDGYYEFMDFIKNNLNKFRETIE